MATVTAIADYIGDITGQSKTGGNAERTRHIVFLNDAYQQIVEQTGCYNGSFSHSLTNGTADYVFGTSPITTSDILMLRSVWVSDAAANTRPLVQISEPMLRDLRRGSTSTSFTQYYSIAYPNLYLYPSPGSGATINGTYVKAPPALVESAPGAGQESTPTAFPAAFHYKVLGNLGVALAFEFAQQPDLAAQYRALFTQGLADLASWLSRFGGTDGPAYTDPRILQISSPDEY